MRWIAIVAVALLAFGFPGIACAADIEGQHMVLPAKERQVDVTYFRAPGDAPRPSVLLLHGFPQTRHMWRHQLRALAAAGFRTVAPDQRGYSAGARPLEVGAYASDLLTSAALAQYRFRGHSSGISADALYLGHRRRERRPACG